MIFIFIKCCLLLYISNIIKSVKIKERRYMNNDIKELLDLKGVEDIEQCIINFIHP